MEEKRRFKAEIAGKQYTIVGNRSADHLNTVVDIVNQQLEQLGEVAADLNYADRSILMAVNAISDQLVKEQRIIELENELAQLKNEKKQTAPAKQHNIKARPNKTNVSTNTQKNSQGINLKENQPTSENTPID